MLLNLHSIFDLLGSLPSFSQIISNTINITKDALIKALDEMPSEEIDSLLPLFRYVRFVGFVLIS